MTLEEYINKLIELAGKHQENYDSKSRDAKKTIEAYDAQTVLDIAVSDSLEILCKNGDLEEIYQGLKESGCNAEAWKKEYVTSKLTEDAEYSEFLSEEEKASVNGILAGGKDDFTKLHEIRDVIKNNKEALNLFDTAGANSIFIQLKNKYMPGIHCTEEGVRKIMEFASSHNKNHVNFIPEEEKLLSLTEQIKKNVYYPYADKVSSLKKSHPEASELLDKANLLTETETDNHVANRFNTMFEAAGKAGERYQLDFAMEYLKKNNLDQYAAKSDIMYSEKKPRMTRERSMDDIEKEIFENGHALHKDAFKEELHFPENVVTGLSTIYDEIEEANLSFDIQRDLGACKTKIKDALDSGSMNQLATAVSEYEKTYGIYDKAFQTLSSFTGDELRIPANMSFGRSTDLPVRFFTDLKGSSLYNAMSKLAICCKDSGTDFKEVLKNPIEGARKLATAYTKLNPIKYRLSGSVSSAIEYMVHDKYLKERTNGVPDTDLYVNYGAGSTKIGPSFALLSNLCPKEQIGQMFAFKMNLHNLVAKPFNASPSDVLVPGSIQNGQVFSEGNSKAVFERMIMLEGEDREIYAIGDKDFINPETMKCAKTTVSEYLKDKKTTAGRIITRLADAETCLDSFTKEDKAKAYKRGLNAALKQTAKDVLESGVKLTNSEKNILKAYRDYTVIPEHDMLAVKKNVALQESIRKGTLKADGMERVKDLAELTKSYKAINPFVRFFAFFGQTARLNDCIRSMTSTLKKTLGNARFTTMLKSAEDELDGKAEVKKIVPEPVKLPAQEIDLNDHLPQEEMFPLEKETDLESMNQKDLDDFIACRVS